MKASKLFLLFFMIISLVACGTKKNSTIQQDTAVEPITHKNFQTWYYFSDEGIHLAKSASAIPQKDFLPWTESVRVSDIGFINGSPAFLINKLGLMIQENGSDAYVLKTDSLFKDSTAGGLYKTEFGSSIRFYIDTNFNEQGYANRTPFLVTYNEARQNFMISVRASDFGLPETAQCISLDRVDLQWLAAFKNLSNSKVVFSYFQFDSFPQPLDPNTSNSKNTIQSISNDTYQRKLSPLPWNKAPEQLQDLLAHIPATTGLHIKISSRALKSNQIYSRASDLETIEGFAFVSDDKTAVLFTDGTFYMSTDNSSSQHKSIKLPALSNGYAYSGFVLKNKTLLAAWEEKRFYEIGRSGLLEINLPDELYLK